MFQQTSYTLSLCGHIQMEQMEKNTPAPYQPYTTPRSTSIYPHTVLYPTPLLTPPHPTPTPFHPPLFYAHYVLPVRNDCFKYKQRQYMSYLSYLIPRISYTIIIKMFLPLHKIYDWCLNRHLCILPERFAKKDLNLVIVCPKDVMS